jgi:ankyrin repeat protein
MLAARDSEHAEVMTLLLKAGADAHARTKSGMTARMGR